MLLQVAEIAKKDIELDEAELTYVKKRGDIDEYPAAFTRKYSSYMLSAVLLIIGLILYGIGTSVPLKLQRNFKNEMVNRCVFFLFFMCLSY